MWILSLMSGTRSSFYILFYTFRVKKKKKMQFSNSSFSTRGKVQIMLL